MQMIFQDPYSSINPRKKIFDIIAEPLKIRDVPAAEIETLVQGTAQLVGLRPEILLRYPHMLSGGQRQRVGIARALVTEPELIVCDEPVSALDVSVQAQVLNLLLDLQQQKGLSYLFISHDLGVVRFLAHRVAVMYLGRIVEIASRDEIFKTPLHPYTRLLLRSTPKLGPSESATEVVDATELPSPLNPPPGCSFHTRCPYATDVCKQQVPELRGVSKTQVACHHAEKILEASN
jgi:dipeptide transport system ATP-binding protein